MALSQLRKLPSFYKIDSLGDVDRVVGHALEIVSYEEKVGGIHDVVRVLPHGLMKIVPN